MNKVMDINYFEMFAGIALLLIPVFILWYYKTGLVKATLWATVRMTVQLLLVGVYLEYIFKLNSVAINIAWVLMMSVIASYTIVQRSGLSYKMLFFPVLFSGVMSMALTDAFFLGFVIKLNNIFDARYFIPITGMLMGNTLKNIIISLDAYYKRIEEESSLYQWHLANGANHREALLPFMRDALRRAFNPLIANMAIMGLISLPGVMTGQILGGSDPHVAVKYQIVLLVTIFSSTILNVVLTIGFTNRRAFDDFNNLRPGIFRKVKKIKGQNKR